MKAPIWVMSLLLSSCQAVPAPSQTSYSLDGNAWRTWTNDERDGFVTGYYDCLVFEKGQVGPDGPRTEWIAEISNQYGMHTDEMTRPIGAVFIEAAKLRPAKEVAKRSDSIFDGDLWRQMANADRLRYVQAYMACRFPQFGLHPSREAESYMSKVSRWFGIDEHDVSVIDPDRADAKIGDMLSGFLGRK